MPRIPLWGSFSRVVVAGVISAVSILYFTSCGGAAGANGADIPGVAQAPQGYAGLPQPSQISRGAAMISTPLMCLGSEFRPGVCQQAVTADGATGLFSPAAGSSDARTLSAAAYALYDFDLSPLANLGTPLRIDVRATAATPDGTTRIFAALGHPDQDYWQWGELRPDAIEVDSWSWGETQAGPGGGPRGAGRLSPYLPVVIVVFGNPALQVASVEISPDTTPLAAGPVAFRTGWDLKSNPKAFDDSVHVLGDGLGTIFCSFYNDSNGQLNLARLQNRICTFKTVDSEGDVGACNDLVLGPGGQLVLPYMERRLDLEGVLINLGLLRTMAPANQADLVWSPRSNFEAGLDEAGLPISAGAHPSCVFDEAGIPHLFYEDATNSRIRHAWKPLGAMDWMHDYVSPMGQLAGRPVGLQYPAGVGCAYMAEGKLYLAQFDAAMGWSPVQLADDVYNPLDPASGVGFCDGSVFNGSAYIAYSAKGGGGGGGGGCGKVLVQDLSFAMPTRSVVFNAIPDSGVFCSLAMMGDGSVRIADYSPATKKVYFETGDIPTQEFTSLPAIQFGGGDDCDDLDFWVNPASDAEGNHDAALVTLSSKTKGSVFGKSKEFTGHITLIK